MMYTVCIFLTDSSELLSEQASLGGKWKEMLWDLKDGSSILESKKKNTQDSPEDIGLEE